MSIYFDPTGLKVANGDDAEAPDINNFVDEVDAGLQQVEQDISEILSNEIADRLVTTSVTYSVGTGGDYLTLNAALEDLSQKYPVYLAAGVTVTLELVSGFVWEEQVLAYNLDLGWITITSVDATVSITQSVLTTSVGSYYPALSIIRGISPKLGTILSMDTSGSSSSRVGALASDGGVITIADNMGIINSSGNSNFLAINGGLIICNTGLKASGGAYGLFATRMGRIIAPSCDASSCSAYGARGFYMGNIDVSGGNISGSGVNGVTSTYMSKVCANSSNAGSSGSYGFNVDGGSTILAQASTGTLSQTENTLTAKGIIYK